MLKTHENILLTTLKFLRTDFGDIFSNVYFSIFERDPVRCRKKFGAKFLRRI